MIQLELLFFSRPLAKGQLHINKISISKDFEKDGISRFLLTDIMNELIVCFRVMLVNSCDNITPYHGDHITDLNLPVAPF